MTVLKETTTLNTKVSPFAIKSEQKHFQPIIIFADFNDNIGFKIGSGPSLFLFRTKF